MISYTNFIYGTLITVKGASKHFAQSHSEATDPPEQHEEPEGGRENKGKEKRRKR